MKFLTLCLILLFCSFTAPAQKLLVTAKVDRQKILIGERINLTLEAMATSTTGFTWTKIDTLPHFEVMEVSRVDTQLIQNGVLYKQNILITSWDSGSWVIPPITLGGAKSSPIPINVGHTPFDVNEPYNEVKSILEVPKAKGPQWHWYLIGAVLLIMLFYLFFPEGKKKEEPEYKGNAFDDAQQELHQLKTQGLAEKDPKLFYTKLVQIFRDYLFRKKKWYSYSKTTDDLVELMNKLNLDKEQQAHLRQTLMVTDMVKFAKYKPGSEENAQSFQNIQKAITTIEQKK